MKNDPRSCDRNFYNCVKKPEKAWKPAGPSIVLAASTGMTRETVRAAYQSKQHVEGFLLLTIMILQRKPGLNNYHT